MDYLIGQILGIVLLIFFIICAVCMWQGLKEAGREKVTFKIEFPLFEVEDDDCKDKSKDEIK